jgi:hypothetical protein
MILFLLESKVFKQLGRKTNVFNSTNFFNDLFGNLVLLLLLTCKSRSKIIIKKYKQGRQGIFSSPIWT